MIRTPILAQLHDMAVVPALVALNLDTPAARNLLLGTAAQETGGRYIAQVDGPALGFWQIEPATAADTMHRVAVQRGTLYASATALMIQRLGPTSQLGVNLLYAAAVCRLKYWLDPRPLPDATDVTGLAAYWKSIYNTDEGAGDPAEFIANFAALIGAPPNA